MYGKIFFGLILLLQFTLLSSAEAAPLNSLEIEVNKIYLAFKRGDRTELERIAKQRNKELAQLTHQDVKKIEKIVLDKWIEFFADSKLSLAPLNVTDDLLYRFNVEKNLVQVTTKKGKAGPIYFAATKESKDPGITVPVTLRKVGDQWIWVDENTWKIEPPKK